MRELDQILEFLGITRLPGQDMSNEYRLANHILTLKKHPIFMPKHGNRLAIEYEGDVEIKLVEGRILILFPKNYKVHIEEIT